MKTTPSQLILLHIPPRASVSFIFLLSFFGALSLMGNELPELGQKLTDKQVSSFAKLALMGMDREYPNKPSNVMADKSSVLSPREMHPAFYGCFDWHSSVHGHWMLIRLLKLHPGCSAEKEIRARLNTHLTAEKIKKENEYFLAKHNKSFERMYGWAWLLRMVAELESWDDDDARKWRDHLRPLEKTIVARTLDYLPRLSFPIRTGIHPDSGFALGQVLDYARAVGNRQLEDLIVERSRDFYLHDKNYPTKYEPSGQDFFSSGLNEADLMRRVLSAKEFSTWLDGFFPDLHRGKVGNLLIPVEVTELTDGHLTHLAGLDLARGWTMLGIASVLPRQDPRREILEKAAREHAKMGYQYVFSGHYEGEHWLATFAIYLQTAVGQAKP
ncbi:MAG: DUF2891 domain-containing protein [Planctomycetota bacterium]|nr:DUF2891 domain-containing protein [Planctomycetota bacterium]